MRKKEGCRKLKKITRILTHSAQKEKRMKRYRLTKITIKTREIISAPATAANKHETAVCPVCHAPLPVLVPAAQSSKNADLSGESADEFAGAKLIN
jgi:hypothetical protein